MATILLLYILLNLLLCLGLAEEYALLVDAGSTGSRAYLYKLSSGEKEGEASSIVGQKVKKIWPGLSSFSTVYAPGADALRNGSSLADACAVGENALSTYLLPILERAVEMIPSDKLAHTAVHLQGTAGMRLLDEDIQGFMWQCVVHELVSMKGMPLSAGVKAQYVGTINGHREAYYAVLASNFIAGRIDTKLRPVGDEPMIGALDMGGSSTQLVFHTGSEADMPVRSEDFWSHSYLSMGVNTMREAVWGLLYDEQFGHRHEGKYERRGFLLSVKKFVMSIGRRLGRPATIRNPCTVAGYRESFADYAMFTGSAGLGPTNAALELGKYYSMVGTGEPKECVDLLRRAMWPSMSGNDTQVTECILADGACALHDVEHPHVSVVNDNGKGNGNGAADAATAAADVKRRQFYAMSVYYYALDCIRSFAPVAVDHWPQPTLAEIKESVHSYCAVDWDTQVSHFRGKHKYTTDEQFPYRCMEGLYIGVLLEEGFGFHANGRDITMALKVEGLEVEWTLGYALAEIAPRTFSAAAEEGEEDEEEEEEEEEEARATAHG